mgnify:CR=1 FL=1
MNEKEKELLLKGINLGIFLAFADTEANLESRLILARRAKADEESLNSLKAQIEVYEKLLDDFSDHKCSSITNYFSDLTIDGCNLVYSKINELCLDNVQEVYTEFDYVITEALLRR